MKWTVIAFAIAAFCCVNATVKPEQGIVPAAQLINTIESTNYNRVGPSSWFLISHIEIIILKYNFYLIYRISTISCLC